MYGKFIDKDKYLLDYFCPDLGFPKIEPNGCNVYYLNYQSNKYLRLINFNIQIAEFLLRNKYDLVFHLYTKYNLITRFILLNRPLVLDIRTGDLSENNFVRRIKNFKIAFASLFYKKVSIISESLAEVLKVKRNKIYVIPLGGEIQPIPPKSFETLKLLYVGTLTGRRIHETIIGLGVFQKKMPGIVVSYDIVGDGNQSDIDLLINEIERQDLSNVVRYHGRKNFDEIKSFLISCNTGIVYVPNTPWYKCQPSTKVYEYALAGLALLVTETPENIKLFKEETGILFQDNPFSFQIALEKFASKRQSWNSDHIRNEYCTNTWEHITENFLIPFIESSIRK